MRKTGKCTVHVFDFSVLEDIELLEMAEDKPFIRNSSSPTQPDSSTGQEKRLLEGDGGGHTYGSSGYTTSEDDEQIRLSRNQEIGLEKSMQSRSIEQTYEGETTFFVYVLSFFAAIGGFLFGYDTGVISGASLQIQKYYELNDLKWETIVSITIAGAAIGAFLGRTVNEYLGRKRTMIVASLVFTLGAVCMAVSPVYHWQVLLTGRGIVGIGIGLASMTVPIYIAECAPSHMRGKLVTVNNLFITGGQAMAGVVDGAFGGMEKSGWRFMLGLAGVPSVILFFGFLFLPETPRWLLTKNRYDEARRALSKIRGKADVSRELSRLQNKLKKDEQQEKNSSFWDNIKDIARKPHIRRAVIVGCGLQAIQQLSGINTVMYYNVNIIQMAGVSDDEEAIWFGALVATGNFAFTIIGLFLVERIGRRKLLLGSLFGVFLSLGFLSAGFWVAKENSPYDFIYRDRKINGKECIYPKCDGCILNQDCGFCYATVNGSIKGTCQHILNGLQFKSWTSHDDHDCRIPILIPLNQSSFHYSNSTQFGYSNETNWANSYCPFSKAWIIIVALVFYLAWFAPGMGPMPWTVNSEIYPNRFRSTGQSLATAVNWIFNLAVSLTFLTLSNTETLGRHGAFLIYAGFALLGWIFIYATVPETKGLKLEQVVKLYKTPFRPACCGKSVAYEALDGKLSGTDLEVDEDLP